jgi:hypothetical protein
LCGGNSKVRDAALSGNSKVTGSRCAATTAGLEKTMTGIALGVGVVHVVLGQGREGFPILGGWDCLVQGLRRRVYVTGHAHDAGPDGAVDMESDFPVRSPVAL